MSEFTLPNGIRISGLSNQQKMAVTGTISRAVTKLKKEIALLEAYVATGDGGAFEMELLAKVYFDRAARARSDYEAELRDAGEFPTYGKAFDAAVRRHKKTLAAEGNSLLDSAVEARANVREARAALPIMKEQLARLS